MFSSMSCILGFIILASLYPFICGQIEFMKLLKISKPSSTSFETYSDDIFDPIAADCYLNKKRSREVFDCKPLVNDPWFLRQWYLVPHPISVMYNKSTVDLGILDVWIKYKILGQGVIVVDADDGVEITHPDLQPNYDPHFGWDFLNGLNSPYPFYDNDTHGTKASGVIAMAMNNKLCGVGVAPRVILGAARVNSQKLYHYWQHNVYEELKKVHIILHGYNKRRYKIPYEEILFPDAMRDTVAQEWDGKDIVHVFAAGNMRKHGLSCAFDDHANYIYTITVAATDPWGRLTNFSGRCANIMVAGPTKSSAGQFYPTTTVNGKCTEQFGGTSSAAALVTGIIALTFNANLKLTRRDVQHLLAITSSRSSKDIDQSTFFKNGAELKISHDFGFGMINAKNMVERAFNFKRVPALKSCFVGIKIKQNELFTFSNKYDHIIETNGCKNTNAEVNYIEHTQLYIKMSYTEFCHLQIVLYSPSGTRTQLLEKEPGNKFSGNISRAFVSVMTWGESPVGKWKIHIFDEFISANKLNANRGRIEEMSLKFFGTKEKVYL